MPPIELGKKAYEPFKGLFELTYLGLYIGISTFILFERAYRNSL